MVAIEERLKSLMNTAQALKSESGELNARIAEVEKFLAGCQIGLPVSVPLACNERLLPTFVGETSLATRAKAPHEEKGAWLCYRDVLGHGWGLHISAHESSGKTEADGTVVRHLHLTDKPLSSCSRATRIAALKQLPKLVDELEELAKKKLATIRKEMADLNK